MNQTCVWINKKDNLQLNVSFYFLFDLLCQNTYFQTLFHLPYKYEWKFKLKYDRLTKDCSRPSKRTSSNAISKTLSNYFVRLTHGRGKDVRDVTNQIM